MADTHDEIRVLAKLDQIMIQQKELAAQQYKLNSDMEKVLMLLQGNPLDPSDHGLIGEVNEIDKRLKKVEDFKNKGVWMAIGSILLGGWGLSDLIKRLIEK